MKTRVTLDLRNVHGEPIDDPRVFVRFANVASGFAMVSELPVRGSVGAVTADLADGSLFRVEISPSRYSPCFRALLAVDPERTITATLVHRASEWRPVFTSWDTLPAQLNELVTLLAGSPRFKVGRNSQPVTFVGEAYDAVDPADESRVLAKASLLNMYALLSETPKPGADTNWFSSLRELHVATRERIIGTIDDKDVRLIQRIKRGGTSVAHGYKPAPAGRHVGNFEWVTGFDFDPKKLFSVKTKHKFGNLQLTVARGSLDGEDVALVDADCDENGLVFLHALDLPKHALTGGTHPIEVHDILAVRFRTQSPPRARDFGYELQPHLRASDLVPHVETRIIGV